MIGVRFPIQVLVIGAEERARRANFFRACVASVAAPRAHPGPVGPSGGSVSGGSSDEEGAVTPSGGAAVVAEIRPRWLFWGSLKK